MKRTIGFALLFTAVYLVVFSSPLRKEPLFRPVWVQNLADPTAIPGSANAPDIGFRIGDVFGYTTPAGTIKYLDTTQFNVAMEQNRFINYSSVSKNLVEKDSTGRIVLSISSDGYPLFMGGRFFVISADRTALSELNGQGTIIWSRDFGSLISAMDANSHSALIGLLNGSIEVIDKSGKVTFQYRPSGSKLPAIYGTAISKTGEFIALVSGLEPQRFMLLKQDARSGYRPTRIVDLGTDIRRQAYLHFFAGVPYVYVELPNAVEYFSVKGASSGKVPVAGHIASLVSLQRLICAVSSEPESNPNAGKKAQSNAELTIFTPSGRVISRQTFAGGPLFLKTLDKSAYIGTGRRLMRIDYDVQ